MYTLRSIKKKDKKAYLNQILGDSYIVLTKGSEGYNEIRDQHFSRMGFTQEEREIFQNPFILYTSGFKEIYLYGGYEYYIMTESGKTFENLSGLSFDEIFKADIKDNGIDFDDNGSLKL